MTSLHVHLVLIVRAREGVEHWSLFGPNRSLTTATTSCEAGLIWSGNFTHGGGLNEIVEHSNSSPITFAVNRLQNSYGISTVGGIFLPRESTRFNVWLRSAFKLPIDFHQVKRFFDYGKVETCRRWSLLFFLPATYDSRYSTTRTAAAWREYKTLVFFCREHRTYASQEIKDFQEQLRIVMGATRWALP